MDLVPNERLKVVYRVTHAIGNNCVGQDVTHSVICFCSASDALIAKDFSCEQRRDFTIRKELPWELATATAAEATQQEIECIVALRANEVELGWRQWLKLRH